MVHLPLLRCGNRVPGSDGDAFAAGGCHELWLREEDGPFDYNVTEVIYGDRVAFIDYNSETAMIIESKVIADFQKHIFKSFYKKLN